MRREDMTTTYRVRRISSVDDLRACFAVIDSRGQLVEGDPEIGDVPALW